MPTQPPRETEIDGLRAVAIVPVVLYHAGWSIVPGGFVGVDIFFVISGYLITGILAAEMEAGAFSLLRFYERRGRRIMPALFVVLAAATVVATAIMLPGDLVLYSKSLLATVLFGSNLFFVQNAGYFDPAATSYALLHTWSLAVEEQFYLLFPITLLVVRRLFGRRSRLVIALLGLASFALWILASPIRPTFAFYLPFTRGWELTVGALLALGAAPALQSRALRETTAAAALLAIVGTVLLLHEGRGFPGWIACIPVLSAAALIRFSPGTLTGRLLSLRPLVGIGLISYSLYLWHWPLLAFAAYWLARPLSMLEGTGLALLAVPLAILSWRFVEAPFRNRSFLNRRTVFAATACGIVATVAVSYGIIGSRGLPGRMAPEVQRLEAFAGDISPRRETCHDTDDAQSVDTACALGAPVPPTLAVWSDSHGVELAYALGELAAKSNRSVLELSSSSCQPTLGFAPRRHPRCDLRNQQVLGYLLAHPLIQTIILTAERHDDSARFLDTVFPGLDQAIAELRARGRTVVIVYPTPESEKSVPQKLAREQWSFGKFDPRMMPLAQFETGLRNTFSRLDALAAKYGLVAIHPTDVYCPGGQCVDYLNGSVLFFDQHHPSLSGARLLAPLFAEIINPAGPPETAPTP